MTEEKKDKKNVSVFSRSELSLETDPLEEIFALNIGDFISEHLISDELIQKISKTKVNKLESLKKQLKELISIYSINNTLKVMGFSGSEEFIIYNSIAKTIKQMVEIDSCKIFLTQENSMESQNKKYDLCLAGASNNLSSEKTEQGYNLNEDNYIINSFKQDKIIEAENISSEIKYCIAIPMSNNMEKVGVIAIENYENKKLSKEFLELISTMARLFATSMSLKKLTEETENLINEEGVKVTHLQNIRAELTALIGDLSSEQQFFVENLAKAVDAKSNFENNYSHKVADLAKAISTNLGLNEKTKDLIYYAALLRNIGKITLPEELFNKKEKLSKEDWEMLQNHPNVGVSILMSINFLSEVVPYINYHKEHWDGSGEPEGLKGFSIPLGSRIIALADAYSALTSKRIYREAMSKDNALKIIKSESGLKWDPELVNNLEMLV